MKSYYIFYRQHNPVYIAKSHQQLGDLIQSYWLSDVAVKIPTIDKIFFVLSFLSGVSFTKLIKLKRCSGILVLHFKVSSTMRYLFDLGSRIVENGNFKYQISGIKGQVKWRDEENTDILRNYNSLLRKFSALRSPRVTIDKAVGLNFSFSAFLLHIRILVFYSFQTIPQSSTVTC